MRRSVPVILLLTVALGGLLLSSCGGDHNSDPANDTTKIAKIVVTPDPVSLNRGTYLTISPVGQNSKGDAVGATFTYTTDNENLATVTTAGEVCAGKWNDAKTVCTAPATTGVATLTVTGKDTKENTVTQAVKVYVHEQIDSIRISGQAPGSCISAVDKATVQLTATAFSNSSAVCGGTTPCALPADTMGKFTWSVNALDSNVLSVDNTVDKQGLVTAAVPGKAFITASQSGVFSAPSAVTVCPVVSVEAAIKDSTDTSFAVEKTKTQALTAVVKDSAGKTFTTGNLNWLSGQSSVMSLAAGTTALTATATGNIPGSAAIVVGCLPPSCNRNIYPVYSNIIQGTTNGDSAGTIYVASTESTSLIPIPISSGTPGTAITMPRAPNSFLMNRQGTKAILGADSGGAMILDTAAGTVGSLGVNGKPLAFSPNGNLVVLFDNGSYTVSVYDLANSTSTPASSFTVANPATGAAFNTENTIAYIAAGSSVYIWSSGLGSTNQAGTHQVIVGSTVKDAALPIRSDSVYITGTAGVDVRAVCNFTTIDTLASSNASMIRPIPNGSGLLAINSPNIDVINITSTGLGCPLAAPTETINSHDLGAGSFTPRQLLITTNSSKAYITSDLGSIIAYDIASSTPSTLAVSGNPGLGQADITYDGKQLFVVAGDSKVHKFDLTNNTEGTPITVTLKKSDNTTAAIPSLLQVRSQ